MSCDECDKAHDGEVYFPWRYWDEEEKQGAIIFIIACRNHASKVINILNSPREGGGKEMINSQLYVKDYFRHGFMWTGKIQFLRAKMRAVIDLLKRVETVK